MSSIRGYSFCLSAGFSCLGFCKDSRYGTPTKTGGDRFQGYQFPSNRLYQRVSGNPFLSFRNAHAEANRDGNYKHVCGTELGVDIVDEAREADRRVIEERLRLGRRAVAADDADLESVPTEHALEMREHGFEYAKAVERGRPLKVADEQ